MPTADSALDANEIARARALLKPLKMTCFRSSNVKPISVWQSQSSLETVVLVTRRLSVLTVTRRPRFL